ncbi:uncharacterized protein LOC134529513 isoform X2 [Bacillus rossius redtenbacheri]|uniref:uncharacterized protein LOC134529513 isoform X2 n=1 Tax=Bacillus rossius redtenbacheri TaxID=93214 RepID=UPI002FDD6B98
MVLTLETCINVTETTYQEKIETLSSLWIDFFESTRNASEETKIYLLEMLFQYTVYVVLQPEWYYNQKVYYELVKAALLRCQCNYYATEKVTELLHLIESPWGGNLLMKLLFNSPSDEVAFEFFRRESAVVISIRLHLLCEQEPRKLALRLAHWYLRCIRNNKAYKLFTCRSGTKNTKDQMNHVLDLVLALSCGKFYVDIINQFRFLRLKEGLELLQRFQKRLHFKNDEKHVFHSSTEIYQLASQHFLTEAMSNESGKNCRIVEALTVEWITAQMLYDNDEKIRDNIEMQIERAACTYYAFAFLYALFPKLQDDEMKTFCFDLYVVLLSREITALYQFDSIKERKLVRKTEVRLSKAFLKLANLLKDYIGLYRECLLTAFSINPTEECHELIKDVAVESGACDVSSRNHGCNDSDGNCYLPGKCSKGSVKRSQTKSQSVNLSYGPNSVRDAQNHALTLGSPNLRLTQRSLDDLASILLHPRHKELHWDLEWPVLNQKCNEFRKTWKDRRYRGQRLRFLNIDFKRQVAIDDGGDVDKLAEDDDDDFIDEDEGDELDDTEERMSHYEEETDDEYEGSEDEYHVDSDTNEHEVIDVEDGDESYHAEDNIFVKEEKNSCIIDIGSDHNEDSAGNYQVQDNSSDISVVFTDTKRRKLKSCNDDLAEQRREARLNNGNSIGNFPSLNNEHFLKSYNPSLVKLEDDNLDDSTTHSDSLDCMQNNQFLNCYNFSLVQVQRSGQLHDKEESGSSSVKTLNTVLEENVRHYNENESHIHDKANHTSGEHHKRVACVKGDLNTNEDIKPVFVGNYVAYVDIGYDTDDDIAEMVEYQRKDTSFNDSENVTGTSDSFDTNNCAISESPVSPEHKEDHILSQAKTTTTTQQDEVLFCDRICSVSSFHVHSPEPPPGYSDDDSNQCIDLSSQCIDLSTHFRGYRNNTPNVPTTHALASPSVTELCDSSEFPESPNLPDASKLPNLPEDHSRESAKLSICNYSNAHGVSTDKHSSFKRSNLLNDCSQNSRSILFSQKQSPEVGIMPHFIQESPVLYPFAHTNCQATVHHNAEQLNSDTDTVLDLCIRNTGLERLQDRDDNFDHSANVACTRGVLTSDTVVEQSSDIEKNCGGQPEVNDSLDNSSFVSSNAVSRSDACLENSYPVMTKNSLTGTIQAYDLRSRLVPKIKFSPKKRYGSRQKLTAVTAAGSVLAGTGVILAKSRPITRSCTILARSDHSGGQKDAVITEPVLRISCQNQRDVFTENSKIKSRMVRQRELNCKLNTRKTRVTTTRSVHESPDAVRGVQTRSKSKESQLRALLEYTNCKSDCGLTHAIIESTNVVDKKSDEKIGSMSKPVAHDTNNTTPERRKHNSVKNKIEKGLSVKKSGKGDAKTRKKKCNVSLLENSKGSLDCQRGISKGKAHYQRKGTKKLSDINTIKSSCTKQSENEYFVKVPEKNIKNLRMTKPPKAKEKLSAFNESRPDMKTVRRKIDEIAIPKSASRVHNLDGSTLTVKKSKITKSVCSRNVCSDVLIQKTKTRSGRICTVIKTNFDRKNLSFCTVASGCEHLAETISGLSSLEMISPPPAESTVNVVQVSGIINDQERPLSPKINNQNLQCTDESSDMNTDPNASCLSTDANSVTSDDTGHQTESLSENFLHISTARTQTFQNIDAQMKVKSNVQTEIKYLTTTNEVNKILQSTLPDTGQSSSNIVVTDVGQILLSQESEHDPFHEKRNLPVGGDTNSKLHSSAEVKSMAVHTGSPISSENQSIVKGKVNAENAFQHVSLSESNIKVSIQASTCIQESSQPLASESSAALALQVNVTSQSCENNSQTNLNNIGINVIASLISSTDVSDSNNVSEVFKTSGKSQSPQKSSRGESDVLCTIQSNIQIPTIHSEQMKNSGHVPDQNFIVYNLSGKKANKVCEEGILCLSQATLPKFQQAFGKTVYHTNSSSTGVNATNLTSQVIKEKVLQNNCTKLEVISAQAASSGCISNTVLSKAVQTTCVSDLSEIQTSQAHSAEVLAADRNESAISSLQEVATRKTQKSSNCLTFQSSRCDSRTFTEVHTQQNTNIVDTSLGLAQKTVIGTRPNFLRSTNPELSAASSCVTMKSVVIPKVSSGKKSINCGRITSFQANNLQTSTVVVNSITSRTLNCDSQSCQEHEVLVIDSSSDEEICYLGARTVPSTAIQNGTLAADQKTCATRAGLAQPRPLMHISGCHTPKVSSTVLKSCMNSPTSKRSSGSSVHMASGVVQIPQINNTPDPIMTTPPTPLDPSTAKLIREFEVVMEEVTNTSQRKERNTGLPQVPTSTHVVSPQSLHSKSLATSSIKVSSAVTTATPFTHDVFTVSSTTSLSSSPPSSVGVVVTYGSNAETSDVNVTYVVPSQSSTGVTVTYVSSPPAVAVTFVTTNPSVAVTYVGSSPASPGISSVSVLNNAPCANSKVSSTPVVTSYCQSVTSPALSVTSQNSSSPCVTPAPLSCGKSPKPSKSSKTKSVKSSVCASSKASPVPKLLQKPQEDEQTAQRIYAILDEYAEQLRNSPDLNNKPAPRRRSNPPTNPNHSSKRKKSQTKAKLLGQQSSSTVPEMSPGTDDPRTIGSEDSSSGITQLSHIQDSPAPSALSTDESVNLRDASSVDNSVETESFTIDEQESHHKLNRLILADANSTIQGRTVIVQEANHNSSDVAGSGNSALVSGKSVVVGSTLPLYVSSGVRQVFLPVTPGLAASVHSRSVMVSKGSKVFRVQAMPSASIQMSPANGSVQGTALVVRQMPVGTPVSVLSHPAVKQVRLPAGSISSQTLTGVTAQPPVVLPPGSHHLASSVNPVSCATYQDNKQAPTKLESKDVSGSITAVISTTDNIHLNTQSTTTNAVQSVDISTTYHDHLSASVTTLITSNLCEASEKITCSKVDNVANIPDGSSMNSLNPKNSHFILGSTNEKNSVDSEITSTKSSASLLCNQQVECARYLQDDRNFRCIGVNFASPTKVTINDIQSSMKSDYVVIGEDKEIPSSVRKASNESESGAETLIVDAQNEVPSSEVTNEELDAESLPDGPSTDENAPSLLCRSSEFEIQEEEASGDANQESTSYRRDNTLNIDSQQSELYNQIGGRLTIFQKDRPDFEGNILILRNVSDGEGGAKSSSSQAVLKTSDHFNAVAESSPVSNTAKLVSSGTDVKKNLSDRDNLESINIPQKVAVLQKSCSLGSADLSRSSINSQMDIAAHNLRRKKQAAAREASWRYITSGVSPPKKAKLSTLHKDEGDTDIIIEHAGVCVQLSDTPLEVEDLTQEHHTYLSDAKLESIAKRHCVDASLLPSYRRNDVPAKPEKLSDKVELVMQQRIAKVEKELRFQKSLSEECEDLGVDEPSTSDLFPEADLLLDTNSSSFEQTLQDTDCSPESSEPYRSTDLQALGYTSSSQDGSQSSHGRKVEEISDRSKVIKQTAYNTYGSQLLDWKQSFVNKEHKKNLSEKITKHKSKLRELTKVYSTPANHSKKENGSVSCQKSNQVIVQTSTGNFSAQNFTNCKNSGDLWNRKKSSDAGINGDVLLHVSHGLDKFSNAQSNVSILKPDNVSCKKKLPESLPANNNLIVHSKGLLLTGSYQSSSSNSSEDSVTLLDNYTSTVASPVEVTFPSPIQPPSPGQPSSPVRSRSPVRMSTVRRVRLVESTQSVNTAPSLTAVQKFTYTYGKRFAHQDVIKRARLNRPNQYFNDHGDPQETWETSSSHRTVANEEEFECHDKLDDFSSFRVAVNSDDSASNNPIPPCFSSVSISDVKSSRVPELQQEMRVISQVAASSQNEKHLRTCQITSKKTGNARSLTNIDNGRLSDAEALGDNCSRSVDSVDISSHMLKPKNVYSFSSQTNLPTRHQTNSPKPHQNTKKQDMCANVNNDTIMRFLIADTNMPSVIVNEDINCEPAQGVSQLSSNSACSKGACKIQRNSRFERRSSLRGHIKRGCSCCSGSPELPSKRKREAAKGEKSSKKSHTAKHITKGNISKKR